MINSDEKPLIIRVKEQVELKQGTNTKVPTSVVRLATSACESVLLEPLLRHRSSRKMFCPYATLGNRLRFFGRGTTVVPLSLQHSLIEETLKSFVNPEIRTVPFHYEQRRTVFCLSIRLNEVTSDCPGQQDLEAAQWQPCSSSSSQYL